MNYDNYYKNGGMTKEESISAIALRIGARKDAVAKFVEKHDIDTNKLNSDLKSGKVFFMDVITGIVGKPNNKYQKEIIKKYGSKMAMGGKTQGYDDREDERLGMDYGKISGKDFVGSHEMREHSRRDDARFEERMAMGGKTQGYDDREDEKLGMEYGKIAGKDFVGSHEMREHSRRNDARFEERMENGGMMDDGGETGRDKNGMLYALQEHVSSGEIASKTNASKYEDIDKIRSKAIQYYLENGDKPYSYSELESVLKKFDHTNSIQSFYLHEYPTDDLGSEINPDATFYGLYEVLDNNGDVYEYLGVTDSLVRERVFEKLANFMGLDYDEIYSKWLSSDDNYAKGGYMTENDFIIGNFYLNSLEGGKYKFVGKDDSGRLIFTDSEGTKRIFSPKRMSKYAQGGYMADGGKLEAGVYRVGKPKRIDTNFYEQKIVEIFDNGDISTASDYARKSGDFLSQKYPIITAEQLKEQYKYAQGGYMADGGVVRNYKTYVTQTPNKMIYVHVDFAGKDDWVQHYTANEENKEEAIGFAKRLAEKNNGTYEGFHIYTLAKGGELDLPKQNNYNKKVLELVNKNNIDSKKEFGQLVVSAFTDANFHSEARKFVSILAKKPEWAKEPKLNYDLPFEELQKEKAKTVWGSEYYAPEDSVENLGRKIANLGLYEFEPIVDSLIFASHMKGLHTIADALEKIKNSEEPENKWNYTDVDEIEYVIVKDKNGKELKFLGKYVLSGVHDLLEKGGKLSEMGKYYSKDNVVSVFVGGKNIVDKNTVSGVWIMKDAKPVAEDEVDMKIGKTTIKKGHNGWVGKTMVENFKGYDWDITTIKNYNGDLTTTAQGGKNEKKDGYGMFSFALFQDPNIRLKVSRPARVTDKVVTEQHEQAVKEFKERQDEIAEIVDKIQAKKKMADGGAIGFDALAKKVAKNYEGDKVKKEYQNQYGKTYDKKEAEEVGKKVAAKVYRQQQANKGKMKKGGRTSSYNPSESKMTKISRKASEIRKENEPWKDAFNRAKAMIG